MSNAFFRKGAQALGTTGINMLTDDIQAVLMDNTYPENLSTDEFYSGISAYALAAPVSLTNKSFTDGIFDADNVTFPTVPAGDTAECVVLIKNTGNPATSRVILRVDEITSFPVATNGGDIEVQWDNGANKIFKL